MENRDAFMQHIARQLGREPRQLPEPLPVTHSAPLRSRYAEKIAEQPCDSFMEFASQMMQVHCELAPLADLSQVAEGLCNQYGGGPILISGDARLAKTGITAHLQRSFPANCWASPGREDNLRIAAGANIGVVFAEYGLCETGGWFCFPRPGKDEPSACFPRRRCLLSIKAGCCLASRNWLKSSARENNQENPCPPVSISSPDQARRQILNLLRSLGFMGH